MHGNIYNLSNDDSCNVCDFSLRLSTPMPGIKTKSIKFNLAASINQVCETSDFLTVLIPLKLQKCCWMVWKMQFPLYNRSFRHDDSIC